MLAEDRPGPYCTWSAREREAALAVLQLHLSVVIIIIIIIAWLEDLPALELWQGCWGWELQLWSLRIRKFYDMFVFFRPGQSL